MWSPQGTADDWLIQSACPGDRVIVDGVQKVGPGTVVRLTAGGQ
jgi:hypothetical protein